jgi:hypothetical protein
MHFMLPNWLRKIIDFHPQAHFIAAGLNEDSCRRFFNTVIGKAAGKAFVFH